MGGAVHHDGTNVGFLNGANYYDNLAPNVTSYDYDAPLPAEDGRIAPKHEAFHSVIAKHTPVPVLETEGIFTDTVALRDAPDLG